MASNNLHSRWPDVDPDILNYIEALVESVADGELDLDEITEQACCFVSLAEGTAGSPPPLSTGNPDVLMQAIELASGTSFANQSAEEVRALLAEAAVQVRLRFCQECR